MLTLNPLRFPLIAILFLTFLGTAFAANIPKRISDVPRITIAELQALQASGETVVVIDTRTPGQWQRAKNKIPGAIRLASNSDLQELKEGVPLDTEIVTYCT